MTVLGHTSSGPEFCACCTRPAANVAVCNKPGDPLFFHCVFCNPQIALKVAAMKPHQLHDVEQGAIRLALLQTPDVMDSLFRFLWDNNVRDLAAAAPRYDELRGGFIESSAMGKAMGKFMLNYTHAIRLELTRMEG